MGDRLTLHGALRPARRLPWGLFCTSTLSSSDLREVQAQSTASMPSGPRTGAPEHGQAWVGQDSLLGTLRPRLQSQPVSPTFLASLPQHKNFGSSLWKLRNVRKAKGLGVCR